jgi:hypothetical protein
MTVRSILIALLLAWTSVGLAQLRNIPEDAERGDIRHVQDMVVQIGGKTQRLAPGAQIRDAQNRLIVPAALPAGAPVRYVLDGAGMVRRVWVLTPEEAARR